MSHLTILINKIASGFQKYSVETFFEAAFDISAQQNVADIAQAHALNNVSKVTFKLTPSNSVYILIGRFRHNVRLKTFELRAPSNTKDNYRLHCMCSNLSTALLKTFMEHGLNIFILQNRLETVRDEQTISVRKTNGHMFLHEPINFTLFSSEVSCTECIF